MANTNVNASGLAKKSRVSKRSCGWGNDETFTLLEAWAVKLRNHGKRGVTSKEWSEIAEKVSRVSEVTRTSYHCHNRMDTIRRYYKQEKAMLAEKEGYICKWMFFNTIDTIVTSSSNQGNKNILPNSTVLTDFANVTDQTQDELEGGESQIEKDGNDIIVENENIEDQPPKKITRRKKRDGQSTKSKYLAELDTMRMDLIEEMKMEKRQILKKGLAEIAMIRGVRRNNLSG